MQTTFEDEAGVVVGRKTKWVERVGVVVGAIVLTLGLAGGGMANATPEPTPAPGIVQAGADDDFTDFDRMYMQSWIAAFLGAGFQRFLNGDGGGQGSEVAGPPPCPFCGATYPDTDKGWTDRAKHMLAVEWDKILDAVIEGRNK